MKRSISVGSSPATISCTLRGKKVPQSGRRPPTSVRPYSLESVQVENRLALFAPTVKKLTAAFVRTVQEPGLYWDEHGLVLRVKPSGYKQWIQRLFIHSKRRELGLGPVRQAWPEAGEQRCWNHKMRNVLDRLPQREQSEAKDLLRAVVYAPRRSEAVKAREVFARRYRPWYPKAVDVLEDDWERMVAFYDFPEDHWKHLRTTNVVESPFAALRLRTTAAKRFKRVESATALIWKLLLVAEKRFRRLDALHLLKDVFEGRKFEDGKPVSTQQRKNAA